jgi:serine/threonine protein kinase
VGSNPTRASKLLFADHWITTPRVFTLPIDLGSYEILSAIGGGGMGEVHRARDTRLNRDVALKILPEVFAADPYRMARFEREAVCSPR